MIPVILLSARAGEESKVEGLEAGADDYLIKPFTARELLARVGSHLDMVRMRSEAARREQELRFQVHLLLLLLFDISFLHFVRLHLLLIVYICCRGELHFVYVA
jgi:response regulator RpfG family c-di-GMP phosphodiesterase